MWSHAERDAQDWGIIEQYSQVNIRTKGGWQCGIKKVS